MADVAVAEGYQPTFGQSPFALARGSTFERNLLWNGAERLIEELVRKDVLPEGATGLADYRIGINGGPLGSLENAIDATKELMRELAKPDNPDPGSLPVVVAGATVRIPRGVMLPEAILILDTLAVRIDRAPRELIVGEVKTYPDRGGHTDPRSLAVARAQAGLYVHALELLLREIELHDKIRLRMDGFLVLTRPGSNLPSVRAREDLRFQVERARRGFELLELAAQGLPPFSPVEDDPIEAVRSCPTAYSEVCLTFCDRAQRCHREALAEGNPTVLGDDIVRFLGTIDLNRAVELLEGADPITDAETDFLRRVAEVEGLEGS
jgi:hypothetical protein